MNNNAKASRGRDDFPSKIGWHAMTLPAIIGDGDPVIHGNAKDPSLSAPEPQIVGPLLRPKGQDHQFRLKDYEGAIEVFERVEIAKDSRKRHEETIDWLNNALESMT